MNSRFVPKIEKPCPANWDEMQGDEKRRFCEHCQLHVHNLSAMTAKEQRDLLASESERTCITFLQKPGQITSSTSEWLKRSHRPWIFRAASALLFGLSSLVLSSCWRVMGKACTLDELRESKFRQLHGSGSEELPKNTDGGLAVHPKDKQNEDNTVAKEQPPHQ